MTWFRNIATGREFQLNGHMAAALAGAPEVEEIAAPGGDMVPQPAATVSESDPSLQSLRKADLEALLADLSEDTTGSKAELLARYSRAIGELQ